MTDLKVMPIRSFETITEIARRGDLYVINNSSLDNTQSRGNVVMDIAGENGTKFPINLLSTWVPQNIGTFCEPILVAKSNEFRSLVGKQILVVIKTEEAEKILARPEAVEEMKKVKEAASAYRQVLQSPIQNIGSEQISISTGSTVPGGPVPAKPVIESSLDDNSLYQVIANFNAGRLSDDEGVQALYTLKPSEEALKEASGQVNNTSSKFYERLTDMLSEITAPAM